MTSIQTLQKQASEIFHKRGLDLIAAVARVQEATFAEDFTDQAVSGCSPSVNCPVSSPMKKPVTTHEVAAPGMALSAAAKADFKNYKCKQLVK